MLTTPRTVKKLVDDRRLGRTNLSVSVGLVGTSNATKKENLGLFDYAHLKVPFPSDFKGSEIHPHTAKHSTPTSYFLMVWAVYGAPRTNTDWDAEKEQRRRRKRKWHV